MVLFTFHIAVAKEYAGKVIAVQGKATAQRDGSSRSLSRGTSLFSGDKILAGGKIQIKFTDGSLLNLASGSEYQINSYSYNKKAEADSYSAELVKGGFRQVTGAIAKNTPGNVEIKTPVATIGVRGTVIEAFLVREILYVGCQHGLIDVSNNTGSLLLGPEGQALFAAIGREGLPPEAMEEKPPALSSDRLKEPPGGQPTEPGATEGRVFIQGGC